MMVRRDTTRARWVSRLADVLLEAFSEAPAAPLMRGRH